jgi:hypothetical protein|tara:strand:+ start:5691 stop:5804 length:114 start_codon:yes stop_codon:yes gene_type:complete
MIGAIGKINTTRIKIIEDTTTLASVGNIEMNLPQRVN